MARVVFYCRDERSNIDSFEYYKQDIEVLEALGHEVLICTRYREIPLRFDAMFVWWWTYALWPVVLCRLLGRPCLVTGVYNFRNPPEFKGMDYFHRPWHQRLLIRLATKWCDLNLFIDEAESRACAEYFGLRSGRYYPCIVQDDYLQGPAASRELAVFNLAWSGRGNLVRKGIPELLRAIRLLKDAGTPVHLYQAGHRGDGAEDLEEMIRSLDIGELVHALGPLSREEKIDRLRRYEIYAQPSHFEGFGLATAEAMGSGACIITCDVGAVRNVVGETGIYVAPGSPEAIADALRLVMNDAALRQRKQQEAHTRARAIFASSQKYGRMRGYLTELGLD
jgi:glycosyltransferase involved in cell wall biosynthesis